MKVLSFAFFRTYTVYFDPFLLHHVLRYSLFWSVYVLFYVFCQWSEKTRVVAPEHFGTGSIEDGPNHVEL